jgi:antitoxin (DNA-binding transcriptional repressor) of toxin-antitoxin stability system
MTVTLTQAQADLAGLIHRLAPGEQLVITENDRPVARLTTEPPQSKPKWREPGLWKGKVTIVSEDDDHLADFAEYMR